MKLTTFLIILFLSFNSVLNAQNDYPILTEIVTDNANLFSESELLQLRQKLTAYETETTHQIVVLTIIDLGNDTVENYAVQTFNHKGNQFGQAAEDNGLLILIAKNEREFRIEVGDGLTPIITDGFSYRIISNIMTPEFKKGDFYNGVDLGTSEIIKLIDDPLYAEEFANIEYSDKEPVSIITKLITSIFLSAIFFIFGILGYNKLTAKKSQKKIEFKSLFQENRTNFLISFLVVYCLGVFFNAYFWYAFLGIIILAFFSTFVYIGFFVLLKAAFNLSTSNFKRLFTGKLGLINFIIYLPFTLLLFFAGFMFSFMPIFMGVMGVINILFNKEINQVMHNVTFTSVLYVFIGIVALFLIASCGVAIRKIRSKLNESFGFSFFNFDKSFFRRSKNRSARGYSSSGSSSYSSRSSSSSSSSSFSGGGGSSSGGGASGSW